MNTKQNIIKHATLRFAHYGLEGCSLRMIAKEVGISSSVIYHYFEDQNALMDAVFEQSKTTLTKRRMKLPAPRNTKDLLESRIKFQLDNSIYVVAIQKYYMTYRSNFHKNHMGYVPTTAYKHMLEVLEHGVKNNEIRTMDIQDAAKILTHAVNGFVLEYYPNKMKPEEKLALTRRISNFLYKSIEKGGDK